MSASALQLDPRPLPPVDWSKWIDAAQAARILGVSDRTLRRRCEGELSGMSAAMLLVPPSGGPARWYVARAADPRLASDEVARQSALPDLAHYRQDQRDKALQRRACVHAFRAAKSTKRGAVSEWIDQFLVKLRGQFLELKISRSRLYQWDQLLRHDCDLEKLIDVRGGNQKHPGDHACWKHFETLYLDERQPSLAQCWRQTDLFAREQGATWISQASCARQLDQRIPVEKQVLHRDPARWRMAYAPHIEQDTERFGAGDCWVGDHTQCDFWVRFGGSIIRPWLTAWQDWRTRRIVGWTLSAAPNSDTILSALRMGLSDPVNMGGPSEAIIDNGKDYDCWFLHGQTKKERRQRLINKGYIDEGQFRGLFSLLQIQVHFSIAYNPNGKNRMERWFGTLHGQFDKSMATYCGGSTATKPESLDDILARPMQIPTFEHARSRIADFISYFNANADHNMQGMEDMEIDGKRLSPNEALARWRQNRRVIQDGALELLLNHWYKPVTVGRNGVTIAPLGVPLSYGFAEPALSPYKVVGKDARGKKSKPRVLVSYDAEDLRTVTIWTEKLTRICVAEQNEFGGINTAVNRDKLALLMKQQRNYQKAIKTADAGRHFEYLTAGEMLASGVLEKESGVRSQESGPHPTPDTRHPTPVAPGSLQLIQTPVDAQAKADRPMRKAAGAEHDDLPPPAARPAFDMNDWGQVFRPATPAPIAEESPDAWDTFGEIYKR